jgi:hypothetical protein
VNEKEALAYRVRESLGTAGWKDISKMLDEQAFEYREEVLEIMSSRPDTLTGKKAISLAAKAKALADFKESVYDTLKILPSTERQGV